MDREDIIKMAKEAGFEVYETDVWITDGWWLEELARFAALVAAAERDACAKEVEDEIKRAKPVYSVIAENALKAIIGRGDR